MPIYTADDGAEIAYDVVGEGKPVLMIHGWETNRHFFKKQVPVLSKKYKVITFDVRGHGESDRSERTEQGLTMTRCAADVKGLIEHLGLKDVNLAGWSMGTSIMFEYVRRYGCGNIASLCVIDMTPKLVTEDDWHLGIMGAYTHKMNFFYLYMMSRDWDNTAQAFVPRMFNKAGDHNAEDIAWVTEQVKQNTPHCMINLWISMSGDDYRDVMDKITVPTLLNFGEDGWFYGRKHGEYLQERLARPKLVTYPNCGHALHMEDADKFNREYAAFLG